MRLVLFGPGYSGSRIGTRLTERGWTVIAVTREGRGGTISFEDRAAVLRAIGGATHLISTVPPLGEDDPVLAAYCAAIATSGAWIGYLSSTGVYGDSGGAWVDETAPIGGGRRSARATADRAWSTLPQARIFRLPGIYGPGRSPLDRVRAGAAIRVDAGDQRFSRVHVDDLVAGVLAGLEGPAGAYNLADDLPAAQSDVIAYACRLLGLPVPPLVPLADAALSPQARAFYSESRRVANGKAKRLLNWGPRFADYRLGLRALSASTSPASASAAPPAASVDQR